MDCSKLISGIPRGRKAAEFVDLFWNDFQHVVDVRCRGVAAEGEENVALGQVRVKPDCRERGRDGHVFGDTRRAARDGDALQIQRQRQPFTFDVFNGVIELRRQPTRPWLWPIEPNVLNTICLLYTSDAADE